MLTEQKNTERVRFICFFFIFAKTTIRTVQSNMMSVATECERNLRQTIESPEDGTKDMQKYIIPLITNQS